VQKKAYWVLSQLPLRSPAYGHAASIADNALSRSGVPTAVELAPDGALEIRHVIGAAPAPEGWASVASVQPGAVGLVVRDVGAGLQCRVLAWLNGISESRRRRIPILGSTGRYRSRRFRRPCSSDRRGC
jgi:hypothetical protein